MKKIFYLVPILLSLSIALPTVVSSAEKNDAAEKEVKFRKASFQMIKYYFRPLGGMAKGKVDFDAVKAKKNAIAVAALSHYPMDGFRTESLTEKSTALPKIWKEWQDFEKEMSEFKAATKILSESTASLNEFKPAFKNVAKACKSCHNNFRKKKKQ